MLSVAYMTLMERKFLGRIQIRFGPNRCGPYECFNLSPTCLNLFQRGSHPRTGGQTPFRDRPMLAITAAIGIFAVIPFGNQFTVPGTNWVVKLRVADVDIGLLYIFGLASLGEYGIILGGGSSGTSMV